MLPPEVVLILAVLGAAGVGALSFERMPNLMASTAVFALQVMISGLSIFAFKAAMEELGSKDMSGVISGLMICFAILLTQFFVRIIKKS